MIKKYCLIMAVLILSVSFLSITKINAADKKTEINVEKEDISDEDEKAFMDCIRTDDPEVFERLNDIKGRRPGLYRKAVHKGIKGKQHMDRLKKEDPVRYERKMEMYNLGKNVYKLSVEYRATDAVGKKTEIKKAIRKDLNRLFDLKEEENIYEITRLENRMAKLKERVDKRRENKEQIVDQRLNQVIDKAEDLSW